MIRLKDGLHPDTWKAFDHVDAAMFTGDPGETQEKFEYITKMMDRWNRKMKEVKKEPWFIRSAIMSMEPNASITMLAHAIAKNDVLASKAVVFGGCAVGKKGTCDLDILVDISDYEGPVHDIMDPLKELLLMTKYGTPHYASFDPFVRFKDGNFLCRTEDGSSMTYAKSIKFGRTMPFKEWYGLLFQE